MLSRLLIAFMAVYGLTSAHAQPKQGAPGADLIVHNAKIFTGTPAQPEASALAVKDGRIYSVGTDAEVLGLKNDTKMALHGDGFIKTHGREKALQTPRLRQLVDSGIPLAMTTNAYRAATFNPWVGISWMVSGRSVSGSEVLARDNRLSRAEALGLFTRTPAWFMNAESEMGMIAPGHLADFALLDRDYFAVPESQIKSIASVLTVMDGRVVFGAQDYSELSPALPEILPVWSPIKHFGGYYGAQ